MNRCGEQEKQNVSKRLLIQLDHPPCSFQAGANLTARIGINKMGGKVEISFQPLSRIDSGVCLCGKPNRNLRSCDARPLNDLCESTSFYGDGDEASNADSFPG